MRLIIVALADDTSDKDYAHYVEKLSHELMRMPQREPTTGLHFARMEENMAWLFVEDGIEGDPLPAAGRRAIDALDEVLTAWSRDKGD
jgi:hypothetical protein